MLYIIMTKKKKTLILDDDSPNLRRYLLINLNLKNLVILK